MTNDVIVTIDRVTKILTCKRYAAIRDRVRESE